MTADQDDDALRHAVVDVAAELLAHGGRRAVSVRSAATAAGVRQRRVVGLFVDREGVLDAVAARGLGAYARMDAEVGYRSDPVQDLRRGWDRHAAGP